MTTADLVRDLALSLARTEPDAEQALRELETICDGRRVAAVRARQQLVASLEGDLVVADAPRAIELLDELLVRLPA
jgi:hypothetical protein